MDRWGVVSIGWGGNSEETKSKAEDRGKRQTEDTERERETSDNRRKRNSIEPKTEWPKHI